MQRLLLEKIYKRCVMNRNAVGARTDDIVSLAPKLGRNSFTIVPVIAARKCLPDEIIVIHGKYAGEFFHALAQNAKRIVREICHKLVILRRRYAKRVERNWRLGEQPDRLVIEQRHDNVVEGGALFRGVA